MHVCVRFINSYPEFKIKIEPIGIRWVIILFGSNDYLFIFINKIFIFNQII